MNLSFRKRLIYSYIMIVTIPFIMFLGLSFYTVSTYLISDVQRVVEYQIEDSAKEINMTLGQMHNIYIFLNSQYELLDYFRDSIAARTFEDSARYNQLNLFLNNLIRTYGLDDIRIYLKGTNIPSQSNFLFQSDDTDTIPSYLRDQIDPKYITWHNPYTYENLSGEKLSVITLSGPIVTNDLYEEAGFLLLDMKTDYFKDIIQSTSSLYGGATYIVNREGNVVLGVSRDKTIPSGDPFLVDLSREFHVKNQLTRPDWQIISIIPRKYFFQKSLSLSKYLIIGFLLATFSALILIIVIPKNLSNRIELLTETIVKNTKTESLYVEQINLPVSRDSLDEIDQLILSYNSMGKRINELAAELHKEHTLAVKNRIEALQAHINPHFLYNTLGSIKDSIELNEKEGALKIIQALSGFFRIALSKGKDQIPLKNELDMVKMYLDIQQTIYGESFLYHIDYHQKNGEKLILRFILQPIVENSLTHGFTGLEEKGIINISVEENQTTLSLIVSDNGVGMPPESLKLLKDGLSSEKIEESQNAYGLLNVNSRIKLYYGREYGIKISSGMDRGVKTTILLPLDWSERR